MTAVALALGVRPPEPAAPLRMDGPLIDTHGRIHRDLRYWSARRGSAHVQPPPADCSIVRFGCTVTVERDDGRSQTFRIVGEDEADPERGTLSHVSPLARALIGKEVGDTVRVAGRDLEIALIR